MTPSPATRDLACRLASLAGALQETARDLTAATAPGDISDLEHLVREVDEVALAYFRSVHRDRYLPTPAAIQAA